MKIDVMDSNNEAVPINLELSESLRLDDLDLDRLRTSSEDHFVERKSFGNWKKDAVKTLVAFANSLPIGQAGFLIIGVKDDGEVEATNQGLDKIQHTLAELLQPVYPRLTYYVKALRDGERHYLVVIIYGSALRPHFSGPSFVREGSQSRAGQRDAVSGSHRRTKLHRLRDSKVDRERRAIRGSRQR
jgi:predicted HTH transcriptional regulator